MHLPVQKYFHPGSYQLLRMWFVVFCLNQIGVHDNQLMLWPQKWYNTGYIVMYVHCTVLQLQKDSFSGAFSHFFFHRSGKWPIFTTGWPLYYSQSGRARLYAIKYLVVKLHWLEECSFEKCQNFKIAIWMQLQNQLVYSLSLRFMGKRCKKQFFSNNFFYNEATQNFPLITNRNVSLPHLLSPKSVFYLT